MRRFFRVFTCPWVTAARVRPVQRPQEFLGGSLLQQNVTGRIEDEHRESTVQCALIKMTFTLWSRAYILVIRVDEN
jgi:hypothetical protein